MDNSDIFILEGRNFRISELEIYDINLSNIENFIKNNINNVPRIISFCDQIYYIAKKSPISKVDDLFHIASEIIQNTYFANILTKIILDILEQNRIYSYILEPCEKALVKIGNTKHFNSNKYSEPKPEFDYTVSGYVLTNLLRHQLFSDILLDFYEQHLSNNNTFNFLFFLIEHKRNIDTTKLFKVLCKHSDILIDPQKTQKIKNLFLSIMTALHKQNISWKQKNIHICYNLLFMMRLYPCLSDTVAMIQVALTSSYKKIKTLATKITEGIFSIEHEMTELFEEFHITQPIDKISAYIKIHNNSDTYLTKRYCAYILADYVHTEDFLLKSQYMHLIKDMNKIINQHNIKY